jgi:hypothetical protein
VSKPRGERVVDVVIVGAGPVGLWLAAELRLAGVDVLVLERLPSPTSLTKSLTVQPRTVELLAMRGLADRCLALGKQVPSSHFALMSNRLDFTVLDTSYPFALFLPQPQLEAVLAEHANALGVPVLREHTVLRVREEGGMVAVDAETPHGGAPPSADGGWSAATGRRARCGSPPGSVSRGTRTGRSGRASGPCCCAPTGTSPGSVWTPRRRRRRTSGARSSGGSTARRREEGKHGDV